MKATRADAQQTQQMMRILQRMHQQGDLEQQQHGGSSGSGSELDSEDGSDDEAGTAAAAAGLDKWLAESPEFQQLLRRVSITLDLDLDCERACSQHCLCCCTTHTTMLPCRHTL
jgi:hypothetical protein